jgi:hypothetical protein
MTRMSVVLNPMQLLFSLYALAALSFEKVKSNLSNAYMQLGLGFAALLSWSINNIAEAITCTSSATTEVGKMLEKICSVQSSIEGLEATAGGIYTVIVAIIVVGVIAGIIISILKG